MFVPIDGENNIIMKGFQHPRPGKCFKTLKSIYIDKQVRKFSKIQRVSFTDTIDRQNKAITDTPTTKHTYSLRTRTKKRCSAKYNLSSCVISP